MKIILLNSQKWRWKEGKDLRNNFGARDKKSNSLKIKKYSSSSEEEESKNVETQKLTKAPKNKKKKR